MTWIKVSDANSLSNGDLVGFDYNNKKLLIAKAQDKIYVTDRICTHEYADLSPGFLNEEEKTVTCPLHLNKKNIFYFFIFIMEDKRTQLVSCNIN